MAFDYKEANRRWYAAHPGYRRQERMTRMARGRAHIQRIKLERGCDRCGYRRNPAALEFHHLDPTKKHFCVGRACCYSLERIDREIAKTSVLCANCHRELTHPMETA